LNASRNIGFSEIVSARALNVAGTSFALFFHHHGTIPQRIGTRSRLPSSSTTEFYRVGRADVVASRQIALRGGGHEQAIERDDLAPRQPIGEATAHRSDTSTGCN